MMHLLHRLKLACVWILLLCMAANVYAAELNCDQKLANVLAKKLNQKDIVSMQQQLIGLGFSTNGADGTMGSKTKAALIQFCVNARFALNDDLLLMLQNHTAISKARMDWVVTLSAADFEKWMAGQADSAAIDKTRQSGNSTEVIALLTRYEQNKIQIQPASWSPDENLFSYFLSPADFNILKSGNEIFKLIEKLPATTYAGKKDFDAAVAAALKDVAVPDRYIRIINEYAKPIMSRKLGETSFANPKIKALPDFVAQALLPLKDVNYPGQEISAAVSGIFENFPVTLTGINLEVAQSAYPCDKLPADALPCSAPTPALVKLVDESFKKILDAHQGDPLVAAIIDDLKKLKNVEYQDDKAIAAALKKELTQFSKQISGYLPAILTSTEDTMAYGLVEADMAQINSQLQQLVVPEIYLELLDDMQDVDYPNADFIWQAIQAKISIAGSNNYFRKTIFSGIENKKAVKMDAAVMEDFKAAKLPPAMLAALGVLPAADTPKLLEDAVDSMFKKLSTDFESFRPLVIAQARKKHAFDKSKVIQWNGKSCACVHSNLAGEVYGVYPYWMAGTEQVIDFSVLTRIGFMGLGFDDKGSIVNASRWNGQNGGFIEEAKTYGSKVDLVIYRDNWNSWSQLGATQKAEAFKKLSSDIVGQLDVPLTSLASKLKPYISLGTHPVSMMGDGVTLNFDGYPQDAESVAAFNVFITVLRNNLIAKHRPYGVNIMFRSSEMGKGIYDYTNLLKLMDNVIGTEHLLTSLYIVQLQEPTTNDKKILRKNIEDGLHGGDRMNLLRNVVTTITFDGHNFDQLADDVIYAKDNFGGIGFWPQPVASGVAAADTLNSVSNVLNTNYLNTANGEIALKPAMCHFVCPNRWAFRISWDIFVVALLLSIPLYFSICSLRAFLEKNFIYFIAGLVIPTTLLSFALMFCDPAWEKISNGNGVLIFVIAAIIGYSIWSYRSKKKKANLP